MLPRGLKKRVEFFQQQAAEIWDPDCEGLIGFGGLFLKSNIEKSFRLSTEASVHVHDITHVQDDGGQTKIFRREMGIPLQVLPHFTETSVVKVEDARKGLAKPMKF